MVVAGVAGKWWRPGIIVGHRAPGLPGIHGARGKPVYRTSAI